MTRPISDRTIVDTLVGRTRQWHEARLDALTGLDGDARALRFQELDAKMRVDFEEIVAMLRSEP